MICISCNSKLLEINIDWYECINNQCVTRKIYPSAGSCIASNLEYFRILLYLDNKYYSCCYAARRMYIKIYDDSFKFESKVLDDLPLSKDLFNLDTIYEDLKKIINKYSNLKCFM